MIADPSTGQSLTAGQFISSPWFQGGPFEITQAWGPSDYTGEPEGHGYAHWHAGIDVGCDCGTVVVLPDSVPAATVRSVDNPGGYGIGLVVELPSGLDVWLGHLRQRLFPDGASVRAGDQIAITNNSGASTGCHCHFEVRPHGKPYGTDVDPSGVLLSGGGSTQAQTGMPGSTTLSTNLKAGSSDQNPYSLVDPRWTVWEIEHDVGSYVTQAEHDLARNLIAQAQVGLGAGLVLAGMVSTAWLARGRPLGDLPGAAAGLVRGRITKKINKPLAGPPQPPPRRVEPIVKVGSREMPLSEAKGRAQLRILRARARHAEIRARGGTVPRKPAPASGEPPVFVGGQEVTDPKIAAAIRARASRVK